MADLKTKPNDLPVEKFLNDVPDESVRDDCRALVKLMRNVTGSDPKMWGNSIIGFGKYHYKYDSGHEGDMCLTGFSPRKQNISLYVMPALTGIEPMLKKLGKHKASKGCLYIKTLKDVDENVLERIIAHSVRFLKTRYG